MWEEGQGVEENRSEITEGNDYSPKGKNEGR